MEANHTEEVVAYCRVSTLKSEQLDSLDMQRKFFKEYCDKQHYNLINIYPEEGKSGTKIKNRKQLLKLLSDAKKGCFKTVLIKDVSRLARNTLDFLTSIRQLRDIGVKVIFVNYNQTSSESSEFLLTILAAIAQEESSNISMRVKFTKKMNAAEGRVPNIAYGYDKIKGDYFNLKINEFEAGIVREIYDMYINRSMGANKIAYELNRRDIKTKRNCSFNQYGVARILSNALYTGRIINGKQEVKDFLTGKRIDNSQEKWMVKDRPDLAIIDRQTFDKAQQILESRKDAFHITGERHSEKNLFSQLIKCKCCGMTFRRYERTYANKHIRWLCNGRNRNGVNSCINGSSIEESDLVNAIRNYFIELLNNQPSTISSIVKEFNRLYKTKEQNKLSEAELTDELNKAKKLKQKQVDMFERDIITVDELQDRMKEINGNINKLSEELRLVQNNISKSDVLEDMLKNTFKDIENVLNETHFTNALLRRIIDKIVVDEHGKIDVYLKLLDEIGLDETVHINDVFTYCQILSERYFFEIR